MGSFKKHMDIESAWYEFSPYLYAVGGTVAIFYSNGSFLLKGSGFLLITAVFTILRMRWVYRRALDRKTESALEALMQNADENKRLIHPMDDSSA